MKPTSTFLNGYFQKGKGKSRSQETCLGQRLGRRENDPSQCSWSLSLLSGPRRQPMKSLGGEGPPLGDEPQKSSQRGESRRTDAGDGNFVVQRGSGEGGSRGIKRDIGAVGLDTHAGVVSGRALVGAEGEEASQEAKPTVSAFSRNRNSMWRRPRSWGLWSEQRSEVTLRRQQKPHIKTDPASDAGKTLLSLTRTEEGPTP